MNINNCIFNKYISKFFDIINTRTYIRNVIKSANTVLVLNRNMSEKHNLLKPPKSVKTMQVLDKSKFLKQISLPYIDIGERKVSDYVPTLKKYFLKIDAFKPVNNQDGKHLITLNPLLVNKWEDINEDDRKILLDKGISDSDFKTCEHTLKFENFSIEDVFRAVLPEDKEGMASFTQTGHIVHVNLRDHLLPYKQLIGEVLLEKIHGCKTVVNKVNNIDNTYRFFKMEVLSGVDDFNVKLKESKCVFTFDFSKVYWNSRLSSEHERIVDFIKADDVLFDVFAGVGPFAVPAAKKRCKVYANDLNPESHKWLLHNVKTNKVTNVETFNLDGGEFITDVVKKNLIGYMGEKKVHIVMNLPALATEFLHNFIGLYETETLPELAKPITVYVYCFAKGENPLEITKKLINNAWGFDATNIITDIYSVRTVSNFKEMMRVTMNLNIEILKGVVKTSKRQMEDDENILNNKRIRNGEEQEESEQRV